MKNPTISEVARRAGVSKSTVSAVLNHKDIVSEGTRQNIQRIIDELDYRPRASAQRRTPLSSGKSLGFVTKEAANPYYAEAVGGIQQAAFEHGYQVYVASSEGEYSYEKQIVEQCRARDFDGLIVTPILNDDTDLSHIFELKRSKMPFVLLERVRGVQASLVDIDNVRASALAAKHLFDRGHTHIIHFAGPSYSSHSDERVQGVRRAFSESRHVCRDSMIVEAGSSLEEGYRAGLKYFSEVTKDRPTGVTCYNDLVALGLLRALKELGISVPGEVAVVGFDDLHLLDYLPVGLTTIHVPKFEMGKQAAELLIRQIEHGRSPAVEKVILDARLVMRETA